MGVIRKKSAHRAEGGQKYVCNVCSADITSTVRIHCAHNACNDYDLCVECFAKGEKSHSHQPQTHPFCVIEQNSVPIYDADWGADEELALLEGAETYGLGSWADIAEHIGGFRERDEVSDHYQWIYLDSSKFPLPERASPSDLELMTRIPRDEFQANKKRRIEERRQVHDNAPAAAPKTKPTSSVPSCHEIAGYMPGRLEFETEHFNEAEEAVQHMQFDPGDGLNPRTGDLEPEMELKMTVMDIYNSRLTQRADRKKVIFEHNLLEYKKNAALDKKRTKEERDLLMKTKPFARMMNHNDYEEFCHGLVEEHTFRQAIAQLQDWRAMKIGDLRAGEKYETEKSHRLQKQIPMGSMDRESYAKAPQRSKAAPPVESPSGAALLVAPDLDISRPVSPSRNSDSKQINGRTPLREKNVLVPSVSAPIRAISPLSNIPPLHFSKENVLDLHLLTPVEADLCEKLRLYPKAYLVVKDAVLREAVKGNGALKRRVVKEILGTGMDAQKGARIWEFFCGRGWIGKG